jgi:hypothetical protein
MVALSIMKKMHPRGDIEHEKISVETQFIQTFLLVEIYLEQFAHTHTHTHT